MESNTVLTLPKDGHCNWLQDRLRTSGVLMLWPNCPRRTRSNVYMAQQEPNDPLNIQVKSYELKSGLLPGNTACQLQQACGQTVSAESSGTAKWCPVRVPSLVLAKQRLRAGRTISLPIVYISEFVNWIIGVKGGFLRVYIPLFCQGLSWRGYIKFLSSFSS